MTRNHIVRSTLVTAIFAVAAFTTLSAQTSAKLRFRNEANDRDPVQFLLKRDKQLSLTATQKDSLKALGKQLDEEEKPLFKEVDKYFTDNPGGEKRKVVLIGGSRTAGGTPPRTPTVLPAGVDRPDMTTDKRGSPSMSPVIALIQAQIYSKQDIFREHTRALLNEGQIHIADSLRTAFDAEKARDSKQQ